MGDPSKVIGQVVGVMGLVGGIIGGVYSSRLLAFGRAIGKATTAGMGAADDIVDVLKRQNGLFVFASIIMFLNAGLFVISALFSR